MAQDDDRTALWWARAGTDESTFLAFVCAVLAILALADGVSNFLPQAVKTSVIFIALGVVLRLLTQLDAVGKKTGERLYAVETITSELLQRAQSGTSIQRYQSYDELYGVLTEQVRRSDSTLRLTHIREDPPEVFGHDEFYVAVDEWLVAHPACPGRRIIALNPRMRAWAEQLREAEQKHANLRVKVTRRSAGLPVINMVILDEIDVFLFISGETAHDTAGVWIHDREVGRYFTRYYDHLWRECAPLAEALEVAD
jgi:hypothetical protein